MRTTVSDKDGVRAADLVKRQFAAGPPNPVVGGRLHVYVAFAIDVFSPSGSLNSARLSPVTALALPRHGVGRG